MKLTLLTLVAVLIALAPALAISEKQCEKKYRVLENCLLKGYSANWLKNCETDEGEVMTVKEVKKCQATEKRLYKQCKYTECEAKEIVKFHIEASPAGPNYNWKTDVTLTCYWDPTKAGNSAEFLIDNTSIYRDNSPYVVSEEDTSKVEVSTDMDAGQMQLIIKDLTAADTHEIKCSVSWQGLSPAQQVTVNEPPTTPVSGIAATRVNFTAATISFDAVADATKYTVGWQARGAADWEEVEIADVTYGLTGLQVATTYTVRVKAGNDAGYRDDVELATVEFRYWKK